MDEENIRARSAQRTQWMECAQRGDREAYRALLTDIASPLLRFLRRRIADPHELEDVYQDTLMALHRARHTYDPSRPFEPWLFAIARHVARRRRWSTATCRAIAKSHGSNGRDGSYVCRARCRAISVSWWTSSSSCGSAIQRRRKRNSGEVTSVNRAPYASRSPRCAHSIHRVRCTLRARRFSSSIRDARSEVTRRSSGSVCRRDGKDAACHTSKQSAPPRPL